MSVDPLKSGKPRSESARVGAGQSARGSGAPRSEDERRAASGGSRSADSLEVSAASRQLIDRSGGSDGVPQGSVGPERLRVVLQRLEGDFYEGGEVRELVARRVQEDLGLASG